MYHGLRLFRRLRLCHGLRLYCRFRLYRRLRRFRWLRFFRQNPDHPVQQLGIVLCRAEGIGLQLPSVPVMGHDFIPLRLHFPQSPKIDPDPGFAIFAVKEKVFRQQHPLFPGAEQGHIAIPQSPPWLDGQLVVFDKLFHLIQFDLMDRLQAITAFGAVRDDLQDLFSFSVIHITASFGGIFAMLISYKIHPHLSKPI